MFTIGNCLIITTSPNYYTKATPIVSRRSWVRIPPESPVKFCFTVTRKALSIQIICLSPDARMSSTYKSYTPGEKCVFIHTSSKQNSYVWSVLISEQTRTFTNGNFCSKYVLKNCKCFCNTFLMTLTAHWAVTSTKVTLRKHTHVETFLPILPMFYIPLNRT